MGSLFDWLINVECWANTLWCFYKGWLCVISLQTATVSWQSREGKKEPSRWSYSFWRRSLSTEMSTVDFHLFDPLARSLAHCWCRVFIGVKATTSGTSSRSCPFDPGRQFSAWVGCYKDTHSSSGAVYVLKMSLHPSTTEERSAPACLWATQ